MDSFKLPSFDNLEPKSSKPSEKPTLLPSDRDGVAQPEYTDFKPDRKKKRDKPRLNEFDSSTFFEEESLLTNIEEYAKKIKEDAEAYQSRIKKEADKIKEATFQEEQRIATLKETAEKEAKEIVEAAEQSRDALVKEARDEGFKAGFDEGTIKFKEKNEKNTGNVLSLLKELRSLHLTMVQKNETQIAYLCNLIAKKIVHHELKDNDAFVLNLLKESMKHFEGMGTVRIRINPLELDFLRENQKDLTLFLDENQLLSIKGDKNVSVASAIIESDLSLMDLDLQRQFKEIDQQIASVIDDRKETYYKAQQSNL